MISLQLPDDRDATEKVIADFKVQDGDDVRISQILPYNEQAIYLEGHIFHPGKYPYRDGITLSDLLHSYQDVMPEPADRAEIVRLQAPDFRPEAINFDLHDVLVGNDSIPLRPFDLIRIYSRYEVDPPTVTINGEVLRPGKYPMSQGMTVSGLVTMAGGFRRSAYTEEADLTSYLVQNGQKVLTSHSNIAVQKALDGDKDADSLLKAGDVVSIRSLTGWQDIGATVTIKGEVEHAGTYGITDGEHLSEVLKRAGGFLSDAYPYAAVMQRQQGHDLNLQARQQMIRRIEETPITVSSNATGGEQTVENTRKALEAQRQSILDNLRNQPVSGRMVINISTDINNWANTFSDVELRAGDTLYIPKRPDFVMASGQLHHITQVLQDLHVDSCVHNRHKPAAAIAGHYRVVRTTRLPKLTAADSGNRHAMWHARYLLVALQSSQFIG
jgi:protein involved in polysaccharide export with SLBB domain